MGAQTEGAAGGAISGAATGFAVGGPIGAAVGGVVGGVVGWLGGKSQKRQLGAINKAQQQQYELGKRQLAMAEAYMAEGKDEREAFSLARQDGLKLIQQDVMREPGTSQLYKTGLKRGSEDLARRYSAVGLLSGPSGSTDFRRNSSLFAEGLMSREIEGIRAERRALAGLGPATASPNNALNAMQLYGGSQANISNLGLAKGQVNAGLYKDIAGGLGSALSRVDLTGLKSWFNPSLDPNGMSIGPPALS